MAGKAPPLFDLPLWHKRLQRAAGRAAPDFLLVRASAELSERLLSILRDFGTAVDLGTLGPQAAQSLARHRGIRLVIRASPLSALIGRGNFVPLVATAEALPFATASLDLVVSLLALQTCNDVPGCLIQIRRMLRPDGLFLGCLLGGDTLAELRFALAAAEAEVSGGASPRVSPFADPRDLGQLLQRAGFALPVVDTDRLVARYPDLLTLLHDLRAMGASNMLFERRPGPLPRAVLAKAATIYQARFADPDGKLRATFDLVWLAGWAPHPSQQQPLRPGSAQMPLSAALARSVPHDDTGR
jgi:SAM-dependent methyltransferase